MCYIYPPIISTSSLMLLKFILSLLGTNLDMPPAFYSPIPRLLHLDSSVSIAPLHVQWCDSEEKIPSCQEYSPVPLENLIRVLPK